MRPSRTSPRVAAMPSGAGGHPLRRRPRRLVADQVSPTPTAARSRRRSAASPSGTGGRRSGPLGPASPTSRRGCGSRSAARSTISLDEFEAVAMPARPRKKTTVESLHGRRSANHLRPWFGTTDLERLSRSPEEFERYAAAKMRRRALAEDRPQPPRAARADVQDGPAVAVGVGEPARPRREAAARATLETETHRRGDDRRL